jgi:thiosulfate/3-mercaptopyruvate sulfurtransferase
MKLTSYCAFLIIVAGLAGAESDPWKTSDLIEPAVLAAALPSHPKVFYVGFGVLYRSKHIPGSTFAGPGSKPEGITNLLDAVKGLDKHTRIILYCGCCPFDHCPNIRPAFRALREAGFDDIKVADMQSSFGKDWIDKGYPVETGKVS